MSFLTNGLGMVQDLQTQGLGGMVPKTANPELLECAFVDPGGNDDDGDGIIPAGPNTLIHHHSGDNGDLDYAMCHPTHVSPYNSRALRIYLPKGWRPTPYQLSRTAVFFAACRPMTMALRVRNTKGPKLLEQTSPVEEND